MSVYHTCNLTKQIFPLWKGSWHRGRTQQESLSLTAQFLGWVTGRTLVMTCTMARTYPVM